MHFNESLLPILALALGSNVAAGQSAKPGSEIQKLGYYLGTKVLDGQTSPNPGIAPWRLTQRQIVLLAWALIVGGTVATAIGGYWHGTSHGVFQPYFYDYLTPNVTAASAGWSRRRRRPASSLPLYHDSRAAEVQPSSGEVAAGSATGRGGALPREQPGGLGARATVTYNSCSPAEPRVVILARTVEAVDAPS